MNQKVAVQTRASTSVESTSAISSAAREDKSMLIEFVMSFVWLAVAFILSTQVMISEFRRIDCVHTLFESTRAELEKRGLREVRKETSLSSLQSSSDFRPDSGPDFGFKNSILYRETSDTLEGFTRCSDTLVTEKVIFKKLQPSTENENRS